jgi:hypothetical protein
MEWSHSSLVGEMRVHPSLEENLYPIERVSARRNA